MTTGPASFLAIFWASWGVSAISPFGIGIPYSANRFLPVFCEPLFGIILVKFHIFSAPKYLLGKSLTAEIIPCREVPIYRCKMEI